MESVSELAETSNMELPIFFNFVEVARLDQVPPGTARFSPPQAKTLQYSTWAEESSPWLMLVRTPALHWA